MTVYKFGEYLLSINWSLCSLSTFSKLPLGRFMIIKCKNCKKDFELSNEQEEFFQMARQNRITSLIFSCAYCDEKITVNPVLQKLSEESEDTSGENFRCPVSRCTGIVSFIEDECFWGCGECGAIWYDRNNFIEEISNIIKKYPYRANVYQLKKGQYIPTDKMPKDYDELVEKEPDDKSFDSFVRG